MYSMISASPPRTSCHRGRAYSTSPLRRRLEKSNGERTQTQRFFGRGERDRRAEGEKRVPVGTSFAPPLFLFLGGGWICFCFGVRVVLAPRTTKWAVGCHVLESPVERFARRAASCELSFWLSFSSMDSILTRTATSTSTW